MSLCRYGMHNGNRLVFVGQIEVSEPRYPTSKAGKVLAVPHKGLVLCKKHLDSPIQSKKKILHT